MEYSEVLATFSQLADTHFVQRCPTISDTAETPSAEGRRPPAPTLATNEKEMYTVPKVTLLGKEMTRGGGGRRAHRSVSDGSCSLQGGGSGADLPMMTKGRLRARSRRETPVRR